MWVSSKVLFGIGPTNGIEAIPLLPGAYSRYAALKWQVQSGDSGDSKVGFTSYTHQFGLLYRQ